MRGCPVSNNAMPKVRLVDAVHAVAAAQPKGTVITEESSARKRPMKKNVPVVFFFCHSLLRWLFGCLVGWRRGSGLSMSLCPVEGDPEACACACAPARFPSCLETNGVAMV